MAYNNFHESNSRYYIPGIQEPLIKVVSALHTQQLSMHVACFSCTHLSPSFSHQPVAVSSEKSIYVKYRNTAFPYHYLYFKQYPLSYDQLCKEKSRVIISIIEPGHSRSYRIAHAPSEASDQPAHQRRRISHRCPPKDAFDTQLPTKVPINSVSLLVETAVP